ncbi:MAG: FMN-binding protein [Treponema sp.]|jgi:uncharacterized protein with FMN-binding domain|nr:FMN-binding protein [Treponema sp.]
MRHSFFTAVLLKTTAILAAAFLCGCAGFNAPANIPPYRPGIYEGMGRGFRGPVCLLVQINRAGIAAIEILEHEDDEQIGGAAMEELLVIVLDTGSTDVDGISGATWSSEGFLAALEDALNKAAEP